MLAVESAVTRTHSDTLAISASVCSELSSMAPTELYRKRLLSSRPSVKMRTSCPFSASSASIPSVSTATYAQCSPCITLRCSQMPFVHAWTVSSTWNPVPRGAPHSRFIRYDLPVRYLPAQARTPSGALCSRSHAREPWSTRYTPCASHITSGVTSPGEESGAIPPRTEPPRGP